MNYAELIAKIQPYLHSTLYDKRHVAYFRVILRIAVILCALANIGMTFIIVQFYLANW
jgi:hypothetical protein